MKSYTRIVTILTVLLALPLLVSAGEATGQVQLPLETYRELLAAMSRTESGAPAAYALGNARVGVAVSGPVGRPGAAVDVELSLDVLEDSWVLVPVLPAGTPVKSATVAGQTVQLIPTPDGLAWSTNKHGSYTMKLSYRVDPVRSGPGYVLAVPLPEAAATNLVATLPGTGLDVAVIPSAGTAASESGTTTRIETTIPASRGVQLSWNSPDRRHFAISRAEYDGKVAGDGVIWTGSLRVELFTDEPVILPLLARSVTLSGVEIDGEDAPILVEGDRFATLLQGRGRHEIGLGFEVRVNRQAGPPRIQLLIPAIPVSRFRLELPGKKELSVLPASTVTSETSDGMTTATVHVPMTSNVSFGWTEAVPEDVRAVARSNAVIYHTAHAEEGVLYLRARVAYEVTRGETNRVELELPGGVQINRIASASGAVADWRAEADSESGSETDHQLVSVFLDRQVRDSLVIDVYYDVSLESGDDRAIDLPLLRAVGTHRQRGMVALLASDEEILNPVEETHATRVGENQLPAFVRDGLELTVAHTFKYAETVPRLIVAAATPERVRGKFDAQIDTLISLGDVALTGSSSVTIRTKSGSLSELELELPRDVNLLNLTAPALRTYRVTEEESAQRVAVEFTQELEGHFRVELSYERILADGQSRAEVPTPRVLEAEVEQGRVAVEALTAVEVKPATAEQLSAIDVAELPRQLVLKTTNPILLAYKYVHAVPRHRLALEVTRHRLLDVQEAVIDHALYRTLHTGDGLLVTAARFTMRNTRKQFLRVELPVGSEVWSAFVAGRQEKPALAEPGGPDRGPIVLIKIINQVAGFPVELVYATPGERIERSGTIEGTLPRPDVLCTASRWEVYLPAGLRYGDATSNMTPSGVAEAVTRNEMNADLMTAGETGSLQINVPTSGIRYSFEKLYANQSEQDAWFKISYRRPRGKAPVGALAFLLLGGAGLLGYGTARLLRRRDPAPA